MTWRNIEVYKISSINVCPSLMIHTVFIVRFNDNIVVDFELETDSLVAFSGVYTYVFRKPYVAVAIMYNMSTAGFIVINTNMP